MTLLLKICLASSLLGSLVLADNPIVQTKYTADPAPLIYNDTIYLFTGHDEDGSTGFNMLDWRLYTSTDMVNWQDRGSPASLSTFAWADYNAWAGQTIERNGRFYFYVPVHRRGGEMAIGVGVSDNIEGPYEDAIGAPLVENAEIDPSVFIDDDGQAYLYWGNPGLWYVRLNEDMISYSGEVNQVQLTTEGFGTRREGANDRPTAYEEGPWVYKRDGTYYLIYAANCCSEDIRYATGPSVTGPWTYRGLVMATEGRSFTNHPGVIDYKGNSYFFYHNGALPGGSGYTRSVAVEQFQYGSDGSIPQMAMSNAGAPQIETLNPYRRVEAETIAWSEGLSTEDCSEGGQNVADINNGDYIKVAGVDFGDGATGFTARVASQANGGNIEIHLGSTSGALVGTCSVPGTGGWQQWTDVDCEVSGASGVEDVFFVFTGSGSDFLFNFNYWQFTQ
ncbi:glycosyl hydrolase [Stachybotrys elegans]|uniref:Glycosyl hydrolase n=1 Tax=Stachybotrys elegans TaxID=80388 RepID=A0A8K0WML4_9HYPO|nr:glycosyl hydrolase [Stachybotrys elegans]